MNEKPPILIEEQIQQIFNGIPRKNLQMNWLIAVSRVQRDADVAYYEPEIRQRGLLAVALLNVLRKAGMLNYDTCPNGAELLMFAEEFCEHNPIQQARQEVAEDI